MRINQIVHDTAFFNFQGFGQEDIEVTKKKKGGTELKFSCFNINNQSFEHWWSGFQVMGMIEWKKKQ